LLKKSDFLNKPFLFQFFFGLSHCNERRVEEGTENMGKMACLLCGAGAKRGHFAFCANFGTIFGRKKNSG